MKDILVPLDFSDNSLNALRFAVEIAKMSGASLTLFNSFHVSGSMGGLSTPPVEYVAELAAEREANHKRDLDAVAKQLEEVTYVQNGESLIVETVVLPGLATDNIDDLTIQKDFDLIVMGTRGASGVAEVLWGSITSHVIDRIHIPVMAIPEKAEFSSFHKIVYATNFDDDDIKSIDFLKSFSDYFKAELTCLHVSRHANDEDEDIEKLHSLESNYWFTPISRLNFELVKNQSVEKGLTAYLKESKANLVAVMPQERSFLEELMHSSLTKKLSFHSEIPFLVLRK